jgi:hypothetical protein
MGEEGTLGPQLALHSQFGDGMRILPPGRRGERMVRRGLLAIALGGFDLLVDDLAGATFQVVWHVDTRFAHAV